MVEIFEFSSHFCNDDYFYFVLLGTFISPSSKVSHLTGDTPEGEALQMLYVDAMGVVTHYAINKLTEVVVSLSEKKKTSDVTIASTFYTEDGDLMDEWRPLLRVLHLGGTGDPFSQSTWAI